jgi:homoserine dehydrogenase
VRVAADKEREAIHTFGSVSVIEADVAGEFAFITDEMTEKDFNKKAEAVGIISRIRVED